MWVLLRTEPFRAQHWRRQVPVGPYFVDFASLPARLVIEVDGASHFGDGVAARDATRTAALEARGFRVIRFTTPEVLGRIEAVGAKVLVEVGLRGDDPPNGLRPVSPSTS